MVQTARRYIEIEVDAADALRTLRGIEDASRGTERSLSGLQRQIQAMGTAFQAFVGFLGVQELVGFADSAADIEQQLGAVTDTVAESEAVFAQLLDITGRLGVGIVELSRSFSQLSTALPEQSTQDIIEALDTVSTVLATTGATTQQVNAVLLQLNQALASNVLQGDEFRSVYENAPVLLKAWQEAAELTDQSLRDLSASGAFTTDTFFELLPQIREIAVELIGMEQPALTVARAFEILRSNIIALFKESESVSIVMSALANAIVLVAENLDLLITAAAAFAALKLPGYLRQMGASAGLLRDDVQGLSLSQEAFNRGTDVWLSFVDYMNDANRSAISMSSAFDKLRSAVNSTVGQFVVLFAVFESWNWAIERINEASQAMDNLVARVKTASEDTREFVERFTEIRDLDIGVAPLGELEEGLRFVNTSIRQFERGIEDAEEELSGLVNAAGRVSAETRIFDPEAAARAGFLAQQIENLRRQLLAAEIESEDLAQAVRGIREEAKDAAVPFDDLAKELDAFIEISQQVEARRFKFEAELELLGLEGIEEVRVRIEESFDKPVREAGQAIDEALTRLQRLNEGVRFAESRDEIEKFKAEIEKQNEAIEDNVQIVLAVQEVRAREEESLIRQAAALEQAKLEQEAYAEALRLTGAESENTADVQFALQDLYEQGTISLEQLTRALGELYAEAQGQDLDTLIEDQEELIREQEELVKRLSSTLAGVQQEALDARAALDAFNQGGEQGLVVFERQRRLQEAFTEALQLQGTTFRDASQEQLSYARAATRALEDQLQAQDELNSAQRESQAILDARARIESIGGITVTEVQDFGDISRIVDDITVQAVNGNRAAAQELFAIAEENLRRLAEDVEGPFAERELDRAKREIQQIVDIVFREPDIPPGSQLLDAEIAAAAELAVPTLVAPIVVDPESVDQATEDLQARLSSENFTIQVTPELIGLGVDDVLTRTVNQEGAVA